MYAIRSYYDDDFELIREYYGKTFLQRQNKKYSPGELLLSDIKLTRQLDELEKTEPETVEQIVKETRDYKKLLGKYHLRSWLVTKPSNRNNFV